MWEHVWQRCRQHSVIHVVLCDNTFCDCDFCDHVKLLPVCTCGQAVKSNISDSVGRGRDTKRSKLWYLWGWQWWQHSQHFAALASLSAPICCGYRSTRSTDRTDRISFQVSFQVPVSRCVSTALATYDLHMLHMRHCLYIESPTELLGQCLEPFDILTCKDKQSTGKWLYKGIPMASGGSSVEILCYWHASKQRKHGKQTWFGCYSKASYGFASHGTAERWDRLRSAEIGGPLALISDFVGALPVRPARPWNIP